MPRQTRRSAEVARHIMKVCGSELKPATSLEVPAVPALTVPAGITTSTSESNAGAGVTNCWAWAGAPWIRSTMRVGELDPELLRFLAPQRNEPQIQRRPTTT